MTYLKDGLNNGYVFYSDIIKEESFEEYKYYSYTPIKEEVTIFSNEIIEEVPAALISDQYSIAKTYWQTLPDGTDVDGNGTLLTLVFLVGQLIVWNQLIEYGYTAEKNPANAFFYLITGVHGAHLLGGLIAWIRAARKIREGVDPSVLRVSVELCAIYWHFLLFVWVVMLALFLNT